MSRSNSIQAAIYKFNGWNLPGSLSITLSPSSYSFPSIHSSPSRARTFLRDIGVSAFTASLRNFYCRADSPYAFPSNIPGAVFMAILGPLTLPSLSMPRSAPPINVRLPPLSEVLSSIGYSADFSQGPRDTHSVPRNAVLQAAADALVARGSSVAIPWRPSRNEHVCRWALLPDGSPCGRQLTTFWGLKRHIARVHARQKWYPCFGGCNARYTRADTRGRHWHKNPGCEKRHYDVWVQLPEEVTLSAKGRPRSQENNAKVHEARQRAGLLPFSFPNWPSSVSPLL